MRTQKSIRVFENPFLEKLTHVHPLTPLILWVPVIGGFIYRSYTVLEMGFVALLSIAGAGLFFWTLTEYLLHRYAFHFHAKTPLQKRLLFLIHGLHHDAPSDATRLVMPPAPAIFLASLFYGLFWLVLGPVLVEPFFAFFMLGYLIYDYTHFAVHHFKPRTPFGKWNKYQHMQHHFVNPNLHFGVSSPFWDFIFGTLHEAPRTALREPKKRQVS